MCSKTMPICQSSESSRWGTCPLTQLITTTTTTTTTTWFAGTDWNECSLYGNRWECDAFSFTVHSMHLSPCTEGKLQENNETSCHCSWNRATVLQSLPVSCHFQGCKAPLFRIVSGAISIELTLPFYPSSAALSQLMWMFSTSAKLRMVGWKDVLNLVKSVKY